MKLREVFFRKNFSSLRVFAAIIVAFLVISMISFMISFCVLIYLLSPEPYPYGDLSAEVEEELIDDGWKRLVTRNLEVFVPVSYGVSNIEENLDILRINSGLLEKEHRAAIKWLDIANTEIELWAEDTVAGPSGYITNVLITRVQVVSAVDEGRYMNIILKTFPGKVSVLDKDYVEIGNRRAGRLSVEWTVGPMRVSQLTYVFKGGNTIWCAIFSTAREEYHARLHTFEQSAGSFRLLRLASPQMIREN